MKSKNVPEYVMELNVASTLKELCITERFELRAAHMTSMKSRLKNKLLSDGIPSLILIRGLPGSGKTALGREIAKIGYLHLETDTFFVGRRGYIFNPMKIREAHAWCLQSANKAIKSGHKVVVSNTFILTKELLPYLKLSSIVMVLETNGRWKNVHGVSDEIVKKMAMEWQPLAP
jgi:stage III sporulation protein SpoIIIAA